METTIQLMSIRQTAKTTGVPEHYLRIMEKQGKLPGVRSGNRFLVSLPLLIDWLNIESLNQAAQLTTKGS